jgi:hypothetical protein
MVAALTPGSGAGLQGRWKRARRGTRIWSQLLERTPVEGDQAGGGAPSSGNAMVARAPVFYVIRIDPMCTLSFLVYKFFTSCQQAVIPMQEIKISG